MSDETALTVIDAPYQMVETDENFYGYQFEELDHAAQAYDDTDSIQTYLAGLSPSTQLNQKYTLRNFCTFLDEAEESKKQKALREGVSYSSPKVHLTQPMLMSDARAWKGITYRVLKSYIQWMLNKGYPHGTINNRISTIHVYCVLAGPRPEGAGILDEDTLRMILTVKGHSEKKARRIDEQRDRDGIPTRVGIKGAPVEVSTSQALALKKTWLEPVITRRKRDELLQARDVLMMALFIEHALRVGEVVILKVESFDLLAGKVTIYRPKTQTTTIPDIQVLKRNTQRAAEVYIAQLKEYGITSGYLFPGYNGRHVTTETLRARVLEIGQLVGIPRLTPHALRHFWAFDVLRKGTPLDRAMEAGGWKTLTMLLRYARRLGIANEGVIISEEEDE